MRYAIIQDDNKGRSLFWSETLQQWIELDGEPSAIAALTSVMRSDKSQFNDGSNVEDLLSEIAREIDKKYA